MPYVSTPDGAEIFYQDYGTGRPVLLSHGWPLSSEAWAYELKVLADAGYRAIAHDRRGHGRSSRTSGGNDMDTYARDLASLVEQLDLTDLTVVGFDEDVPAGTAESGGRFPPPTQWPT